VIGQSEARDIVDKQQGEVKCGSMFRWKGFHINWSAEISSWMLVRSLLCYVYVVQWLNKKPCCR